MSFLDRVNVGTAKLHGLQKDLALKGNEFNIASLIFFVSYGEWSGTRRSAKALLPMWHLAGGGGGAL